MNSSVPTSLGSTERQARSSRVGRSRARPDAVLPVVGGDEVAARVAHDGHAELARQLEHVAAEAVLVGGRMAGLVDPAVDGAAHVLDERAEQPLVHLGDREGGVDHQARPRPAGTLAASGGESRGGIETRGRETRHSDLLPQFSRLVQTLY